MQNNNNNHRFFNKIENILSTSLPILLVGKAGTAKSSILREIANRNGRELIDLRVAMMPPEDLVGIPKSVNNSYFKYLPPEWVNKAKKDKGKGILINLEEIHLAPPAMHAALYQLLQEKSVAGVDLSDAWIAGTANPPEQAGAAFMAEMPEALKDRLEIIDYENKNMSLEWLQNLGDELGLSKELQKACGVSDLGITLTPRATERLFRLLGAGILDEKLISRRAGFLTSNIISVLKEQINKERKEDNEELIDEEYEPDVLTKIVGVDNEYRPTILTQEGVFKT